MRHVVLFAAVLAVAAPASANLIIVGGNDPTAVPDNNDFKVQLATLTPSLDRIYNGGADIKATANGFVDFYYHGAESGFTNKFVLGAATVLEGGEQGENDEAWDDSPTKFATISVNADDLFSSLGIGFQIVSGDIPNTTNGLAGTAGFGVFFNSSGAFLSQLFFGFDDLGAGEDDNHDDMIVSAIFRPADIPPGIPEPSSMALLGLGIAGLGASRFRKNRNQPV